MSEIKEWGVKPEEIIKELENAINNICKDKYAFQVGLNDLNFNIDEEQLKNLGIAFPFQSIDQAEDALKSGAIQPTSFFEHDSIEHNVLVFDHRPVGFSGFMDCVTHSLALTDKGLFEVGRYPAVSLSSHNRYWQWFLHRRLATIESVSKWQEENELSKEQFIENVYHVLTHG